MATPDYTSLDLPPAPMERPYVLVNMVMSADGKVAIEGTEQGIGSKTDQRLMRELRVNADAILNGAGTLRASGTSSRLGDAELDRLRIERGKPRCPVAAVLSRSGDLPLDRVFFTARDFPAVVYLSSKAPARRRKTLEATGRPVYGVPAGDELPAMLRHMRQDLEARVLLVEGGPDVNAGLFRLGLVDEYFLTLGPLIVAGRDTLTAVEGDAPFTRATAPHLQLVSAVPDDETNEVYCRYRVQR
jgi:2,5-diamino-6-(ribosylamino)-4(3H)-pyrimidinone 5'-phosphate reductase